MLGTRDGWFDNTGSLLRHIYSHMYVITSLNVLILPRISGVLWHPEFLLSLIDTDLILIILRRAGGWNNWGVPH